MTTAIHYSAVRQPPKAGQIYGLQVAVLDWLRAWLRYARQEKLTFLIMDAAAQQEVLAIAAEIGIDPARLVFLDGRLPRENLPRLTHVFRADSSSQHLFWQRAYAGASFSFCGLAHAVTGPEAAEALEAYCLAPTSAADAIICPSQAVASAIRHYWAHVAAFWKERVGATIACPVRLPVIPLGVDTARIEARVNADKRKEQRAKLGLEVDAIVLLWVGRLSHAIKAHPIAMFRAAELAAQRTGKPVHLVMQGYFVPEEAGAEFAALAQTMCPTARFHFIAADNARFPDGLWAAGDIFLSLVDNMQESFGLTPIEAIAAGLPRVLSNWDGYRDAVTHGEDGFLIPTIQPPPGAGVDLAATLLGQRESYGGYLALVAQCVAVDAEAAADAIVQLIESPELRVRMAAKAKERLSDYDWAKIIPAYEEAWAASNREDAKERPESASQAGAAHAVHAHAVDPFFMFQDYASEQLSLQTRVTLAAQPEEMKRLFAHKMNTLAAGFMIPSAEIPNFIGAVAMSGTPCLRDVFVTLPLCDAAALWRTAAWLLKLGFLRVVRD